MWQKCHLCPKYSQLQVWKRGLQGCGWVSPQRRKQVCSKVCVSICTAMASKGAGCHKRGTQAKVSLSGCHESLPERSAQNGREEHSTEGQLPQAQGTVRQIQRALEAGRLGRGGEALAHRATECNLVTLRSQAWPPPSSTVCPQVSLSAILSPCLVESRQPDIPDLTAA